MEMGKTLGKVAARTACCTGTEIQRCSLVERAADKAKRAETQILKSPSGLEMGDSNGTGIDDAADHTAWKRNGFFFLLRVMEDETRIFLFMTV